MKLQNMGLAVLGLAALLASAACTRDGQGGQAVPASAPASAAAAEKATDSTPRADRAMVREARRDANAEAEAVHNAARVTAAAADVDNLRSRIEARRKELREQAARQRPEPGAP
ncbi:hypothetical protein [Arenimonas terrae]|jgi:predicted lipid-binding transport protein (Tim44 family)|uniref:DUF4398 domain-containing protein n=1 Tax=Arenimonas terrae TaxID=2546226 RepID=A0A5C4RSG3_9GAMM|nr:hypothetical protein [Arenimonas terrae]TNJ33904.1 hypothetical protein E1B00_11285 [Arenimonas terrae]